MLKITIEKLRKGVETVDAEEHLNDLIEAYGDDGVLQMSKYAVSNNATTAEEIVEYVWENSHELELSIQSNRSV